MSIVIAIDGYSSTGKSTIAKRLAEHLGYKYIDTGAMYRMVALDALSRGWVSPEHMDLEPLLANLPNLDLNFHRTPDGQNVAMLNGVDVEDEIRSMAVSQVVSKVSSISEVRRQLVAQQQRMGKGKGVVLDGRDIGTVVFPDAEVKIFMTADIAVRAERRLAELVAKGQKGVSLGEVADNLAKRDKEDQARADSPLIQADDALTLDNSTLSPEDVFQAALSMCQPKL